jgi:hypothetical protein
VHRRSSREYTDSVQHFLQVQPVHEIICLQKIFGIFFLTAVLFVVAAFVLAVVFFFTFVQLFSKIIFIRMVFFFTAFQFISKIYENIRWS